MLRFALALAAILIPAAVHAQVTPPPVIPTEPTQAQAPTPATTPAPEPSPTPTAEPTDAAAPEAQASPTPRPTAPERPTAQPTPDATPEPIAPPIPVDGTALSDIAPPQDVPTLAPTPPPPPTLPGAVTTTVATDRPADNGDGWLLWGGIALLVVGALIVGGVVLPRRRRSRTVEIADVEAPEADPVAPPSVTAAPRFLDPAPAEPIPAAAPTIVYRPARIGLNLVSVTATGEVAITNDGAEAIADVRVRATLLAAAAGHEEAVAALHRDPIARLATPPFALGPGETRRIRLVVAAARSGIEPLGVAGRPMMVPLVAVSVDWRDPRGTHRRTQAFAVGVERVDSPKLAPVWLDQDSRSFDAVAARPHGALLG